MQNNEENGINRGKNEMVGRGTYNIMNPTDCMFVLNGKRKT